ncbi:MAG: hypothetical protein M0Z95_24730 [Actinomycetota bacterium]|nr:hypothetical protein [Actinomycetota bacterium]
MDVRFSTAALAALCNSERRLANRWGDEAGRTVGRRLVELCAADADTVLRLPGASVHQSQTGETVIDFGIVTIRGQISADGASGDRIVISSVEVQGGAHR